MIVTRSVKFSLPVIILNKRTINEPALVLLGYIALAIVNLLADRTLLQIGLAIILAFFGSGFSTVTVLFPRSNDLDSVERAALSASISITVGGLLGFALARSLWGLHLWPFLAVTGLYNVICYVLTWYRRRNFSEDELIIRLDTQGLFFRHKPKQSLSSRVLTTLLIMFFLTGAWALINNLRLPHLDPPMTEFFLLGQNGQTEAYPKTGLLGGTLNVSYGIVNRENASASYQVKAYIQGKEVGVDKPVNLNPDESQMSQIEFHIMEAISGLTKVEFVLYHEEKPYRFLHLWIDVVSP